MKTLNQLTWALAVSGCLLGTTIEAQVEKPAAVATAAGLPGISGGGNSTTPVLSADGQFVVFVSQAKNLVTNDTQSPYLNIYVRNNDLLYGYTKLVSVSVTGQGGGNGNSGSPSISSNGQFIAFESTAGNLVGSGDNDTNGVSDVFVREMDEELTHLVSRNWQGTAAGNGASTAPSVSPDGRWVVFESAASDLVPNDNNGIPDIFVRDLQNGTNYLVSVGASSNQNRSACSESAAITPDGKRVVFVSSAGGLVPTWGLSYGDIYVRDLQSSTTYWASSNMFALVGTTYRCFNPVMSDDGKIVVFKASTNYISYGTAYSGGAPILVFRHDLESGITTVLSTNSLEVSYPAISVDGRYVAFETQGTCGVEIRRYDAQTGSNALVTLDVRGMVAASGDASTPVMSADGSKIIFLFAYIPRDSAGCTGGPPDFYQISNTYQIYLRDMNLPAACLLSDNRKVPIGDASLQNIVPSVSADGSRVAFESLDDRHVPADRNRASDVFVYTANWGIELVSKRAASRASYTSVSGLNSFSRQAMSADGRYIVFSSPDSNLVGNEVDGGPGPVAPTLPEAPGTDVFLKDRFGGVSLVSISVPGTSVPEAGEAVISAQGGHVAFVRGDGVYVRDLKAGWISRVGRGDRTMTVTNSSAPSITGDARYVAYQGASGNGITNVFRWDVLSNENVLVSVNRNPTIFPPNYAGNGVSLNPLISKDGRWVIFQSKATDLVTNTVPSTWLQLYARDMVQGVTRLLSQHADGSGFTADVSAVEFSANGRVLLFSTSNQVYLADLVAGTNTPICNYCGNPSISGDARFVVYEKADMASTKQIWLVDLHGWSSTLMSENLAGTGGGNGHSVSPVVTFDGRYVIFASKASDLVAGDTNGFSDLFLRDRILGQTMLLTTSLGNGGPANGVSARPMLGADGRSVIFQSFASDLTSGDFNNNRDWFVLSISSEDSDGDGMDDDWEMAYFGTLSRDGSEDYDGDGRTDLQEFVSGTDPTNQGSVLRTMTMLSSSGEVTILWNAMPGRTYRVQFKSDLNDSAWHDLPGEVTATGPTGSKCDNTVIGATHRYYRVLLTP